MAMTTKIKKWGNSYAVRLPKSEVDRLSLKEGSSVIVKIEPVKKKPTLDELVSQIDPDNLPEMIDWGEDVGNERLEAWEK